MSTTQLTVSKDRQNVALYARELSNETYRTQLTADNIKSIGVPTDARLAIISGSTDVFVSTLSVAPPAPGDFVQAKQELNAAVINVEDVSTLYFVSREVCDVSVSFYT